MVAITRTSIRNSFRYAQRGLIHTFKTQQSFRIQIVCALVIVFFMVFFEVTTKDAIILLFAIAAVLILEIINTVFEYLTDLVNPKLQPAARVVKDTMAGAVFLASLFAVIVGGVIFWPYIAKYLGLSGS
jgi:diacylglycerol kinase